MQPISNELIDSKIKQAKDNINTSYKQYLDDIEGIKALVPADKRLEVEALIMEIDALHEHLYQYAKVYLRPFVNAHIRNILVWEKIAAPANDATIISKQHSALEKAI